MLNVIAFLVVAIMAVSCGHGFAAETVPAANPAAEARRLLAELSREKSPNERQALAEAMLALGADGGKRLHGGPEVTFSSDCHATRQRFTGRPRRYSRGGLRRAIPLDTADSLAALMAGPLAPADRQTLAANMPLAAELDPEEAFLAPNAASRPQPKSRKPKAESR